MSDHAQRSVEIRPANSSDHDALVSIFWETAGRTEFGNSEEAVDYEHRYWRWYWERAREWMFVALDGQRTLGYICGVQDTRSYPDLAAIATHIPIFADLYDRYPAHIHINLTASARGKGVGSQLVTRFVHAMDEPTTPGVHLVTVPTARNVSFYRRNGFSHEVERGGLLCMCRALR